MMSKLVFYLVCFLSVASSADISIIDYYVNLINTETARARTYSIPQDSSAFRTFSDSFSDFGTFDYIIVGAGSAGAVIASRLSEIEENHVLLLEAGGYETDYSDIPGMVTFLQGLEFNWNYNTTPQTNACLGMINRECPYPRGKGLGGTSIINGLMYVRGNKRDYDNWANQGNPGWSYEDVLPYFIKSENSHVDGDKGYHGKDGYLNVEYHNLYSPQLNAFIEANLELGRKLVDFNGKEQLGVARSQLNTINGRRQSAGKAFLLPAINRPHLKILTYSLVIKILIEPQTKEAYGVLFSHGRRLFTASARKEVIVSAGTIGSPQLLMLSGIGPEDHLLSLGIPVVQPLAVGDNFQEHAAYFGLLFETRYMEPVETLEQYVVEYLNSFGPLSVAGGVQGLGFFQTNLSQIPGYPDIELIMAPANSTNSFIRQAWHLTDESYNAAFGRIDPTRTFTLHPMLLHPKSHGTVRLKSSDSYEYPLIDPRFLSDRYGEDIETMYQAIQLALEMVDTNAFKKLGTTLVYGAVPACQQYEYLSKAYWYCQIRQLTSHLYHAVGTCKMGPDPHQGAVVNYELKVHGVRNLRVADASVIPDITSGHMHAPTVMIGEKVSDMIITSEYFDLKDLDYNV